MRRCPKKSAKPRANAIPTSRSEARYAIPLCSKAFSSVAAFSAESKWRRGSASTAATIAGVCDTDAKKATKSLRRLLRRERRTTDLDQALQGVEARISSTSPRGRRRTLQSRESASCAAFPMLASETRGGNVGRRAAHRRASRRRGRAADDQRELALATLVPRDRGAHWGQKDRPAVLLFDARARPGRRGRSSFCLNQPYFKEMDRFVIFETLVHHLDTARFLIGPIEEVFCRTGRINPVMRGEDNAVIMTKHAGGGLGRDRLQPLDRARRARAGTRDHAHRGRRWQDPAAALRRRLS